MVLTELCPYITYFKTTQKLKELVNEKDEFILLCYYFKLQYFMLSHGVKAKKKKKLTKRLMMDVT